MCWKQSRPYTKPRLFCILYCHTGVETGSAWELVRRHSGDRWLKLTKGIFQIIRHHAQYIKCKEEGGEGGTFGVMWFVFTSHCYTWWGPGLLVMAKLLPSHGEQWNNFLFCLFAWVAFAFPIKLSLSQSMNFLPFTLPIPALIPLVGEWESGCVRLGCWLWFNHGSPFWCPTWVIKGLR